MDMAVNKLRARISFEFPVEALQQPSWPVSVLDCAIDSVSQWLSSVTVSVTQRHAHNSAVGNEIVHIVHHMHANRLQVCRITG